MWSKVGRNVEGLHTIGVLFTKDKCLLCVNLCVVLIFMNLFLWVFPVYVVSIYLLLLCNNLYIFIALSTN
jgi:hypothetical protein